MTGEAGAKEEVSDWQGGEGERRQKLGGFFILSACRREGMGGTGTSTEENVGQNFAGMLQEIRRNQQSCYRRGNTLTDI